MLIKKITKLKNDFYKIDFERFSVKVHEDLIIKYNLFSKKEIDNDILSKLSLDNSYYEVYSKALNYISFRMRSKKEIEEFLNKKELESDQKIIILDKLTSLGLLNDEAFKKAFIKDKMVLTNWGPYKIIKELKKHDITASIEEFDMSEVDEKINKIIPKLIKQNKKYSNNILRQKVYNHLIDLGYDAEVIGNNLSSYDFTGSNNLEKDFQKLFNKYEKKYPKDKLYYQLRGKLRTLGYNLEEINDLIREKEKSN